MNRKTITLAALAATLMLGTSASAFARPDGREAGGRPGMRAAILVHMLQELDTNKDGKISKEEAQAGADKRFTEIDADKDGILTPGEIRKHREARREEWRAERDKLEAERATASGSNETAAAPEQREGRNRDGRRGEHAERGHDRERHGGRHEARGDFKRHGPHAGMRLIRMADTDENGQISKQESVALTDKMFERMDTNKDGFITADDMPKRPLWHR